MFVSSATRVASTGHCAAPRRPFQQAARFAAAPARRVPAPARAAEDPDLAAAAAAEPEDARGAIAVGLKFSGAGQWEKAQEYFERALELPGTGLKRWRDKPRQLSRGETQAALYNIACCRSQLGDVENGLIAIAGCLEQGYEGFQQLRTDPDLAALREDQRFDGLLRRFDPAARRAANGGGGFFGIF